MVSASHWVGLTLPGMIDEPGSFSGSLSSPKPQRGPEPSSRMSLAILFEADRDHVERARQLDQRVVRGQRLELVVGGDERQAGERRDLLGEPLGEARRRVQAGADRGAALGQLVEPRQGLLDPRRCRRLTCWT